MITLVIERYYLSKQEEYILEGKQEWEISKEHYDNYVSSIEYFRSLDGTELLEEHSEGTTLTSFSPDKRTKIVRTFYLED
jgi:hypothetical protein